MWLRPHWSCGRGGTGRRESARFCTLYSELVLFKYLYPRCPGLDLCSTWFENVRGQEGRTRCGEHKLAAGHCIGGIRRAPRLMTSPGRAHAPFALRPPGVGARRPRAVDGACAFPPRLCVSAVLRALWRPLRYELCFRREGHGQDGSADAGLSAHQGEPGSAAAAADRLCVGKARERLGGARGPGPAPPTLSTPGPDPEAATPPSGPHAASVIPAPPTPLSAPGTPALTPTLWAETPPSGPDAAGVTPTPSPLSAPRTLPLWAETPRCGPPCLPLTAFPHSSAVTPPCSSAWPTAPSATVSVRGRLRPPGRGGRGAAREAPDLRPERVGHMRAAGWRLVGQPLAAERTECGAAGCLEWPRASCSCPLGRALR